MSKETDKQEPSKRVKEKQNEDKKNKSEVKGDEGRSRSDSSGGTNEHGNGCSKASKVSKWDIISILLIVVALVVGAAAIFLYFHDYIGILVCWFIIFCVVLAIFAIGLYCLINSHSSCSQNIFDESKLKSDDNQNNDLLISVLEQQLDQWKFREEAMWDKVYKMFYGIFLMISLPLLTVVSEDYSNIHERVSGFAYGFLLCGGLLIIIYFFVSLLYSTRIAAVKRTYDYGLKELGVNRITTKQLLKKGGKFGSIILNIPVNPSVIFVQYSILVIELLVVTKIVYF